LVTWSRTNIANEAPGTRVSARAAYATYRPFALSAGAPFAP
jgi:hypothetical protein